MTDASNIEQALKDAEIEIDDYEPSADGELETDEDKIKKSPKLILARIIWIGDQITRVSLIFIPNLLLIYVSILCINL